MAEVLSLPDQQSGAAQWQIVSLSAGKREGMVPGQVLRVFTPSKDASLDTTPIVDWRAVQESSPFPPNEGKPPVVEMSSRAAFSLPAKGIADAVIFLAYERVSYALITQSTQPVRVGDCLAADKRSCWPNRE